MPAKKIFITGTSGTGKSAIVRNLNNRGVSAVDTDAVPQLGCWRHKETGEKAHWYPDSNVEWHKKIEWHKSHDWVFDRVRFKQLIEKNNSVVAGLASNQGEFVDLFTATILLQCEEKIFIQRIMQREDNSYGKEEAEQQEILRRYKRIESEMLHRGAVTINANQPLDQVVDEVVSFLGKM